MLDHYQMNTITDFEISQLPAPPIEWLYFSSNEFKAQLKTEVDYDQHHERRRFLSTSHFNMPYNQFEYYHEKVDGIYKKIFDNDFKNYKNFSPLGLKKYNNINKTKKNKITCNKSTGYEKIDMYGNPVNGYAERCTIYKDDLIEWLSDCQIDHKKSWSYKRLAELFLKHW